MSNQWQQFQDKINALNQREQVIVFVTALVAVVMLMQLIVIDPLLAARKKSNQQLSAVKLQLQQQKNELELVNAQITAGVNRHKEKRQQQLREEVEVLDQKIQESIVAMIPPRLMPQVLESVLAENKELKLISLENKPVVPVLEDSEQSTGVKNRAEKGDIDLAEKQGLYQHGFVLTLSGNYLAAIRYFEQLTTLPWRFYWDDMHYQVDRYPNATITLEVHTVSMAEEWIGV